MLKAEPIVCQIRPSRARLGGAWSYRIALCAIGAYLVLRSGRSYAADFEASCPATLPTLSGHLPGLPSEWTVVTYPFPLKLAGLGVGDEHYQDIRADHEERLPNGDLLRTWSFDGGTSTRFVLCQYSYTSVQLTQKIPPDIQTCQHVYRADRKLAIFEKITCDR